MLNIGGDDKEKLEENMEEIKELVNQGQDSDQQEENGEAQKQQQDQEGPPQPDFMTDGSEMDQGLNTQSDQENQEVEEMQQQLEKMQNQVQEGGSQTDNQPDSPQQESNQDQTPQEGTTPPEGPEQISPEDIPQTGEELSPPEAPQEETKAQDTLQEASEEEKGEDRLEDLEKTEEREEPKQKASGDQGLEDLKDEIEDQISTIEEGRTSRSVEREVAQFEKEKEEKKARKEQPLFLEVHKFEEIQEMVEEMHYLTTEMDDVMEHLVVGVEEDQETVQEAGQIVQEFKMRRDKIETNIKES